MVTNKSALEELASRCEDATGPDHDLDWAITQVRHPSANPHPRNPALFLLCDGHFRRSDFNYTASLDAAMSLVPEGLEWHIDHRLGKGMSPAYASLWGIGARDIDRHFNATGKTPALALCAAALRALAKEKGE